MSGYKVRTDPQKLQVFSYEHRSLCQMKMQPRLWLLVRQGGLEEGCLGGILPFGSSYGTPGNLPGALSSLVISLVLGPSAVSLGQLCYRLR